MVEYMEYYKSVRSAIREEHLGLLLKKSFSSTRARVEDLASYAQSVAQVQRQMQAEA